MRYREGGLRVKKLFDILNRAFKFSPARLIRMEQNKITYSVGLISLLCFAEKDIFLRTARRFYEV